jgi:hypothetical protein
VTVGIAILITAFYATHIALFLRVKSRVVQLPWEQLVFPGLPLLRYCRVAAGKRERVSNLLATINAGFLILIVAWCLATWWM